MTKYPELFFVFEFGIQPCIAVYILALNKRGDSV